MQEIELAFLVASALVLLVFAAVRYRLHLGHRPLLVGALFGVVPGIVGAVVVLVPRTDLVPDGAEPFLWVAIGLVAGGFVLLALWRGAVDH